MYHELLAPAGNLEAGYAALYYGADALYLGLKKFSARAGAQNFSPEELDEITAYAHHLNKKVYVTINTLLQEDELNELTAQLDVCSMCHVDAVILQDLGVARVIRKSYPELEMHASTQMAVHNREGAEFLKKLAFTRVVLARELTLAEIKDISSVEGLETEVFVHGALCYSYSGVCQFSSLEYGKSANRGKCLYPCRDCFEGKERSGHLFSMKDMAFGPEVLKIPATSFKIEGRKKSALYVAAATDYYRRILDGKGADENRAENIKQIFSRPWCRFHLNGKNKDVTDPDFVGHRGLEIGRAESVRKGSIFFKTAHKICRYDGLQIDIKGMEKPFGFSVQQIKVSGKNVFEADAFENVEIKLPPKYPKIEQKDKIYLASSTAVKGFYKFTKPKPKEYQNTKPVFVRLKISKNCIRATCEGRSCVLNGQFEQAKNPDMLLNTFKTCFSKTGTSGLEFTGLEVDNPENLFVPLSGLNELRRGLYASVSSEHKKGILPQTDQKKDSADTSRKPQWIVKVDQAKYLNELDFDKFEEVIFLLDPQTKPKDLTIVPKNKLRLALPTICRHPVLFEKNINSFLESGYKKWEVANYWALNMLDLERIDLSFDSSLYCLNTQAVLAAKEIGASRITLATEDTMENLKSLCAKADIKTVFVVYQYPPLFTSAVCIRANDCAHCDQKEALIPLKRENTNYLAVSKNCQTTLFHREPLCFAREAEEIKADFYRIDLTNIPFDAEKIKEIQQKVLMFQDMDPCRKGNLNRTQI